MSDAVAFTIIGGSFSPIILGVAIAVWKGLYEDGVGFGPVAAARRAQRRRHRAYVVQALEDGEDLYGARRWADAQMAAEVEKARADRAAVDTLLDEGVDKSGKGAVL